MHRYASLAPRKTLWIKHTGGKIDVDGCKVTFMGPHFIFYNVMVYFSDAVTLLWSFSGFLVNWTSRIDLCFSNWMNWLTDWQHPSRLDSCTFVREKERHIKVCTLGQNGRIQNYSQINRLKISIINFNRSYKFQAIIKVESTPWKVSHFRFFPIFRKTMQAILWSYLIIFLTLSIHRKLGWEHS